MTALKCDYQFYGGARIILWLQQIEAWNDIMKVTMLETMFISVDKKILKKGADGS